jgi:hypothetical protein
MCIRDRYSTELIAFLLYNKDRGGAVWNM